MPKLKSVSRKVYLHDKRYEILYNTLTLSSYKDYLTRFYVSHKVGIVNNVGMFIEDAMLLKSLGIVDD
jgi:hypothetical protein